MKISEKFLNSKNNNFSKQNNNFLPNKISEAQIKNKDWKNVLKKKSYNKVEKQIQYIFATKM